MSYKRPETDERVFGRRRERCAHRAYPARREDQEQIELLQAGPGEIRVAEYLVELPPREMLEAKLHEAIRLAKGQVESGSET